MCTRFDAYIDLDDFKGINDTNGHTFGDEILIRFSRIVQDNLLPNHIFARTGGDEFMICFPNEAVNELEQIIEMIITTVNDCELQSIGFSGGIVDTECLKFESYKSMIEKADEKLYIAKRNGKNYVEY